MSYMQNLKCKNIGLSIMIYAEKTKIYLNCTRYKEIKKKKTKQKYFYHSFLPIFCLMGSTQKKGRKSQKAKDMRPI